MTGQTNDNDIARRQRRDGGKGRTDTHTRRTFSTTSRPHPPRRPWNHELSVALAADPLTTDDTDDETFDVALTSPACDLSHHSPSSTSEVLAVAFQPSREDAHSGCSQSLALAVAFHSSPKSRPARSDWLVVRLEEAERLPAVDADDETFDVTLTFDMTTLDLSWTWTDVTGPHVCTT